MTFLKWIAIGVMPFVMIVLGVIAYLTVTKPPLPAPQKAQTKQINRKLILKAIKNDSSFSARVIRELQAEIDSLQSELKAYKQKLSLKESEEDSLVTVLAQKDKMLASKDEELKKITAQLDRFVNSEANAKSLAKTFSSMKPAQIAPILRKLDDEIILSIYQNTNSRYRKNIILALSDDRAAGLSKRLLHLSKN